MKQEIIKALEKAIKELGVSDVSVSLERPTDASHGDFASNVALIAAKKLGKNPRDLAQELTAKVEKGEQVEKVEVAGPGFLNFFLSKDYLLSELEKAQNDQFSRNNSLKAKKIMVEFADPNPFKEFHIGHLRNITIGESYSRLLEAQGATVWRVNYFGDVGMHVAKALYGLLQIQNSKFKIQNLEKESLKKRVEILGQAYAVGSKAYEEDEQAKKEIRSINLKVYKNDPSIKEFWEKGRKWSLDMFEEIYKRVGTTFKRYYPESEIAEEGRKIVLNNVENGIFDKSDGAIVFRGEEFGLHTRVFVTKEDYATYEAKDMALAPLKYKDFVYDESIIITATEQAEYFKVVLAALSKVSPELAKKTRHYWFGFVTLKDGKMSSRTGNIVRGEWLLDEAKKRISDAFKEMDEKTAEMVAVGAVKYSMLKFSRTSDIAFSFEESITLEGNSGPYLQYTYARTKSVLRKAQNSEFRIQNSEFEEEEELLLRQLAQFNDIVQSAADTFSPNILCAYLFDLAKQFNLFYQKHKVIGSEQEAFRLSLTQAVGNTLKTGLNLLGIEAPEKM